MIISVLIVFQNLAGLSFNDQVYYLNWQKVMIFFFHYHLSVFIIAVRVLPDMIYFMVISQKLNMLIALL